MSRPIESKSGYFGTETTYEDAGTLTAEVQPISDTITAELYGVNISRAVQLIFEPSAEINERTRVEIDGELYEVKGVTRYGNCTKAGAEKL